MKTRIVKLGNGKFMPQYKVFFFFWCDYLHSWASFSELPEAVKFVERETQKSTKPVVYWESK